MRGCVSILQGCSSSVLIDMDHHSYSQLQTLLVRQWTRTATIHKSRFLNPKSHCVGYLRQWAATPEQPGVFSLSSWSNLSVHYWICSTSQGLEVSCCPEELQVLDLWSYPQTDTRLRENNEVLSNWKTLLVPNGKQAWLRWVMLSKVKLDVRDTPWAGGCGQG